MRVSIIANSAPGKCSLENFTTIIAQLEKRGHKIVGTSFSENRIDMKERDSHPDVAIVIGGDGTIISACHFYGDLQVPILGVNVGKLGYLAHFDMDQLNVFIDRGNLDVVPVHGRFVSERMLLDVQIGRKRFIAVNDLVVDIGPPFRTTEISLKIDKFELPPILGDGVIIATPTGSTAYNLSVGGSIIHPEVEGIAVTPKNPHRLSFRPLVICDSSTVKINVPNSEGVYFIVDGQDYMPCTACDTAVVSRFHRNLKIVTREDYWSTLTQKLHWGH